MKMAPFKLLINGSLVDGASSFDVINPAKESVLVSCPKADAQQLDLAVAAAARAFPAWAALPMRERGNLLVAVADELEANAQDFAWLLTMEQGKPLFLAHYEVKHSIGMLRAFAAMDLPLETLRETAETRILRQYTPLGVAAAIVPWNFPLVLLMVKFAPALVSGNTLVVKPAPTTPLTTLRLGEICQRLLPAGVVNIITDQNELGGLLSTHPDIRKIAFTGSTPTGRKVMESAAPTLKRLTLELGGNDAALVLDDVNPKQVAAALFSGAMMNSGQICMAIKRAYVPDALYDEVCDELASLASTAIVGDGLEDSVQYGPLQNKAQFDKVMELIDDARQVGTIIAGGHPLDRPGYFISPTIVRDLPDSARLVMEEQFGPALPVLRYSDLDDAIRRVNDCEFGLGASVWSSDTGRALKVAERIDAGTVWINKHLDIPFDVPLRGARQSGVGAEFGLEGLMEYTQPKIINVARTGEAI